MAKPETVRYEVTCQKEPVTTYERKFHLAMQFTEKKEAAFEPVGDAIFDLAPYKERGRVVFKEMEGSCMIVHLQAYPLNRPLFPIQAKVKCTAYGSEEIGHVLEPLWSVPQKKWLYKLAPDEAGSPVHFSKDMYPEDLLILL